LAFGLFFADWLILTYIGACPAEEPYITVGWLTTFSYFFDWLILTNCQMLVTPEKFDESKRRPWRISVTENTILQKR
jgi:hypothetical protein